MIYILLKRAFKNFGDYLIFERAEKLIKENCRNIELVYGDASKSLTTQFKESFLGNVSGIIIPGGPGIRKNMYPATYPLSKEVFIKNIPVYILGGGTKIIKNLDKIEPFDEKTDFFLKYLNKFSPIGCRDIYTQRYLENLSYKAVLNGCPAWYDLNYFGKRIRDRNAIKKILFSVPANISFFDQFLYLSENFMKKYNRYKYYFSFNEGFEKEEFNKLKNIINSKGLKIIDMSGGDRKNSCL